MKPAVFLGVAAFIFALLLGAAFVWDCGGALLNVNDLVADADRELKNQEERVINAIPGVGVRSEALQRVLANYHEAKTGEERRKFFDGILARVSEVDVSGVDPTDPIRRRAADEFAGALNRRQIALRRFQDAQAARDKFAGGFRGSIGKKLQ